MINDAGLALIKDVTSPEDFHQEQWRPVVGYDHYFVSDYGQVKSKAGGADRILRPGMSSSGYLSVSLWKDNVGRTHSVHHLVATAFHAKLVATDEVDHIDRDRRHNAAKNLRWQPAAENRADPISKVYALISPAGERIVVKNLSKFCRENDLNRASMGAVLRGAMKHCGGWRFSDDQ